ncbi:hypothetical protein TI04_02275 [Achromatium sp. WMS2]|nr:hypothetical protein TI04_02275 [Achromatium sp. WMS2]
MHPFPIETLIIPSLLIFIVTFIVSLSFTGLFGTSTLVSTLKSGIFLFYYGAIFDGTYTFSDDIVYMEGGHDIIKSGINILDIGSNWDYLAGISHGEHVTYYLYNAFAFYSFGYGYYAPVSLNVVLTVLIAWIGAIVAKREFIFTRNSQIYFFIFLLLHPDILAWSNIMNGKDILVLFLHVILLLSFSLFFEKRWHLGAIIATCGCFVLFYLRFYVPLMFISAFIFSNMSYKQLRTKLPYLLVGLLFAYFLLSRFNSHLVNYIYVLISENFVNPIFGLIRFILTPVPFHTETAYSFLDFPALFHWLMFIPAYLGFRIVSKFRTKFSKFFITYVLVFIALYSVFGKLQGPRHRVQLDYAWAVFQFIGISSILAQGRYVRVTPVFRPYGY